MPHNIEKSGFHRGQYVGYGRGTVWRIVRSGEGWYATPRDSSMGHVRGTTLSEVSRKIESGASRDRDTQRFTAAERSGRAHALHRLAKRGGSHTYATPEVKRTASYKRAERLEEQLAPQRWHTKGLTRSEYEKLADAWERAGFMGWADNYRAHVEQHKIGRDKGPITASRSFPSRQNAERYLQRIRKKHPEARIHYPVPGDPLEYKIVWKTRSSRDPGKRHRPGRSLNTIRERLRHWRAKGKEDGDNNRPRRKHFYDPVLTEHEADQAYGQGYWGPEKETGKPHIIYMGHRKRDPSKRHRHRTPSAPSFAKQKLISRKIRLLIHEGYPPKQAAAIAYRKYGASRKE